MPHQFVGDLRFVDRGTAHDQSAIPDNVAFGAARGGKQRDPRPCGRSSLGTDPLLNTLHGRHFAAPFGNERSVCVDVGIRPRPKDQSLRFEMAHHRLVVRHRVIISS